MNRVLTITPGGSFDIPEEIKKLFSAGQFLVKKVANKIVFEPIDIQEEKDFGALAFSGFDFWEGKEDDIYAEYYQENLCQT